MDTLLLDQQAWDLVLDASGNIAVASAPYALAQDAASASKLFQGEAYYNTAVGVPYFADILGHAPNLALLKALYVAAAETVPGVVRANFFVQSFTTRTVSGQLQVTDDAGQTLAVPLTNPFQASA